MGKEKEDSEKAGGKRGTSKKEGLGEKRECATGEDEVDVARPRGRHMEGSLTLDFPAKEVEGHRDE